MTTLRIPTNVQVQGNITWTGDGPVYPRRLLQQEPLASYLLPWSGWTKHDEPHTRLPGAAGSDYLGLIGTSFGTSVPALSAGNLETAGATTRYARCQWQLPPEFDAGQTMLIRCHAGLVTTVSDGTATLDVEAFKADREGGKTGADLISTAAIDINETSLEDRDFTVDTTSLAPGDWIDLRLAVAVNDTATGTNVDPLIGEVAALIDIRG